jgi:hypothetical protein
MFRHKKGGYPLQPRWKEEKRMLEWRLGSPIVLFDAYQPLKGGWAKFTLDDLDSAGQQQVVEWLVAHWLPQAPNEREG